MDKLSPSSSSNGLKEDKTFTKYFNTKFLTENKLAFDPTELKTNKFSESYINSCLQTENLINSSAFQKISREGFPLKFYRIFLLTCLKVDKQFTLEDFNRKLKLIYKEFDTKSLYDNNYVPYMTVFDTFDESLPTHFLNDEGVNNLKEILWMIYNKFPIIEYSPLIIRITSLILLFCEKNETFDFMSKLIDMNINFNTEENYKIRFHFKFNYVDYVCIYRSFIYSFYGISDTGKEVLSHFQVIGFKIDHLIESMINSFFFEYLRPCFIPRLLMLFLHDGVKSLFRVVYAILKFTKYDIVSTNNRNEIISTIKAKSNLIKDVDEFFASAYKYSLTKHNNKYEFVIKTEKESMSKRDSFTDIYKHLKTFYIPYVQPEISFIDKCCFIALWKQLPPYLAIKNLSRIYLAEENGYSITQVYNLNKKYSNDTWIMFLILDTNNNVFGGILSNLFKKTNNFERPPFIYLFSILPEVNFYENCKDEDTLYCDDSSIIIGTGLNGPALSLNSKLKNGSSFEYNNFQSCVFGDGNFEVSKFEIYQLTS